MKALPVVVAFCMFCSASNAAQQTMDVISIEYPPYVTAKAEDKGIIFNLLSLYAKEHFNTKLTPLFLPPARAQKVIKTGKWCLSFYPPENNDSFIQLSDKKVALSLYRLKQEGEFKWQSLTELKGNTVAMLRAVQYGPIAQEYMNAGMTVVPTESIEQGLALLLKGRVQYWSAAELVLDAMNIDEITRRQLQFATTPVHILPVGVFFNPNCASKLFK